MKDNQQGKEIEKEIEKENESENVSVIETGIEIEIEKKTEKENVSVKKKKTEINNHHQVQVKRLISLLLLKVLPAIHSVIKMIVVIIENPSNQASIARMTSRKIIQRSE